MKLNSDFPALKTLMRRMGARPSSWSPSHVKLDPIETQYEELRKGIEFSSPVEIGTSIDGLLDYKGKQTVIYIKNTRTPIDELRNDKENRPKFHLTDCRTIKEMKSKNRSDRYVAKNNITETFTLEAINQRSKQTQEVELELYVCKNCLEAINWKDYKSYKDKEKDGEDYKNLRNRIRDEFSLEHFFFEYATFFQSKPHYTDKTAPKYGYAANWNKISQKHREEKNWTCENCGINLEEHSYLLHCHHRNGMTWDNKTENLQALCCLCHREKPRHGHLPVSDQSKNQIQKLRNLQGLHSVYNVPVKTALE